MVEGETIKNLLVGIGVDMNKFDGDLTKGLSAASKKLGSWGNQAERSIQNIGRSFTSLGTKMSLSLTLPLVGMAAMTGNAFMQFDTQMRNVDSIAKLTEEQFKSLSDATVEMSRVLPQSAATLAAGLYDIYSSGFTGAAALDILHVAAMGASAGLTDTATSSRVLTAVLNAYGPGVYSATQAMDILFKSVDAGVMTFEELALQIGPVLPIAKAMGVGLDEVAAGFVALTRQGFNAAEAATVLERVMTSFLRPQKQAKEAAEAYGIELSMNTLRSKGLAGALDEVATKTGGNGQALSDMFGDIRAVRGALALATNGGKDYADALALIETASEGVGATQIALERQSKSLSFQLQLLRNEFNAVAINLWREIQPALSSIVMGVRTVIATFAGLPRPVQYAVVALLAVAAAAGPILVAVGMVIGTLGSLVGILFSAGAAVAFVVANFAAIAPIALIALAALIGMLPVIAALGVGLLGLGAIATAMVRGYSNNLNGMQDKTKDTLNKVVDTIVEWLPKFVEFGGNITLALAKGIVSGVSAVIGAMTAILTVVASFFPHSPVERGPLTELALWGKNIVTEIVRGFNSADFSLVREGLRTLMSIIRDGLQLKGPAAISAGMAGVKVLSEIMRDLHAADQGGVINAENMAKLNALLGDNAEAWKQAAEAQVQYEQQIAGLDDEEDAQEERIKRIKAGMLYANSEWAKMPEVEAMAGKSEQEKQDYLKSLDAELTAVKKVNDEKKKAAADELEAKNAVLQMAMEIAQEEAKGKAGGAAYGGAAAAAMAAGLQNVFKDIKAPDLSKLVPTELQAKFDALGTSMSNTFSKLLGGDITTSKSLDYINDEGEQGIYYYTEIKKNVPGVFGELGTQLDGLAIKVDTFTTKTRAFYDSIGKLTGGLNTFLKTAMTWAENIATILIPAVALARLLGMVEYEPENNAFGTAASGTGEAIDKTRAQQKPFETRRTDSTMGAKPQQGFLTTIGDWLAQAGKDWESRLTLEIDKQKALKAAAATGATEYETVLEDSNKRVIGSYQSAANSIVYQSIVPDMFSAIQLEYGKFLVYLEYQFVPALMKLGWNAFAGFGNMALSALHLTALSIKAEFQTMLTTIIKGLNDSITAFNTSTGQSKPLVPDVVLGDPEMAAQIPMMRQGGITLQDTLAFLHKGEVVAPLDRLSRQGLPGTLSSDLNIRHITINASGAAEGKAAGAAFIDTINEALGVKTQKRAAMGNSGLGF